MDKIADGVELADAIGALRDALVQAMWDSKYSRVRFRVEPVDLTVQVGVTRTGTGSAGIKWHVVTLGGGLSRQSEATQILRVRLAPVLFDENGIELVASEQLITDRAGGEPAAPEDRPSREPA